MGADEPTDGSRGFPSVGTHSLIEFWGTRPPDEPGQIDALMKAAARSANATVLGDTLFARSGTGFDAILLLAESHLAMHADLERGYIAIDIFTCGGGDCFRALTSLKKTLKPDKIKVEEIERGGPMPVFGGRHHPGPAANHDNGDWFLEHDLPGRRHGHVRHRFRVRRKLYDKASRFQDILIFDNPLYGRTLALDGVIQFTDSDEFIYHEMLVHPILLSHPSPSRILVLGGGDGGILRESLRCHNVEQVVLVEIDKDVIEACRECFPRVSQGAFDDPRLEIRTGDARELIKEYQGYFDIVVVDSSESIGSNKALHSVEFYKDIHRALKCEGMMTTLMGSFIDRLELSRSYKEAGQIFKHLSLTRVNVPSYNCGEYCFLIAAKTEDAGAMSLEKLQERVSERLPDCRLRYYTPEMQLSSRLLPPYLQGIVLDS
jgi:spermidine synthase